MISLADPDEPLLVRLANPFEDEVLRPSESEALAYAERFATLEAVASDVADTNRFIDEVFQSEVDRRWS
jgi:hypothetical protein